MPSVRFSNQSNTVTRNGPDARLPSVSVIPTVAS